MSQQKTSPVQLLQENKFLLKTAFSPEGKYYVKATRQHKPEHLALSHRDCCLRYPLQQRSNKDSLKTFSDTHTGFLFAIATDACDFYSAGARLPCA